MVDRYLQRLVEIKCWRWRCGASLQLITCRSYCWKLDGGAGAQAQLMVAPVRAGGGGGGGYNICAGGGAGGPGPGAGGIWMVEEHTGLSGTEILVEVAGRWWS
jgi:hypothetical protein